MTPIYIKRGRRYHEVQWHMPEVIDALPAGAHLIVVGGGGRSTLYRITPAHAPLLLALREHRQRLLEVLRRASDSRPGRVLLTAKEQRAVAAYRDVMGEDTLWLSLPSAAEVLDALEAALVDAAA